MPTIKDGILIDSLISASLIPNIQHEVLKPEKIRAIVLHQTETVSAKATIDVWQTRIYGAHFLIDRGGDKIHTGVDGKIIQTARVDRRCWHVGHILSKCFVENTCVVPKGKKTSVEALAEATKGSKQKAKAVDKVEMPKPYGERYPVNSDSIGIEIVTKFDYKNSVYPPPSSLQVLAVAYLIEKLIEAFPSLTLPKDIYEHGTIGRKQPSEGTRAIRVLTDVKSDAAAYLQMMMPKKKT